MRKSGFTLLELLVAMALLGLLAAAMFTLFNRASDAFDLTDASVQAEQTARAFFEQMQRELQSTLIDEMNDIYFYGTNTALYFVYTTPDGIAETGYSLDTSVDYAHHHYIDRFYQAAASADFTFKTGSSMRYADGITDFIIRYYDASSASWNTTWDMKDDGDGVADAYAEGRLPTAVEITIKTIDRDSSLKYSSSTADETDSDPNTTAELKRAKQKFTAVIFIPPSTSIDW